MSFYRQSLDELYFYLFQYNTVKSELHSQEKIIEGMNRFPIYVTRQLLQGDEWLLNRIRQGGKFTWKIYQSCQSCQELLEAKVTAPPYIVLNY